MIVRVLVTPEAEDVEASVAVEFDNTPKRYARIFASEPSKVDWGWVVHESAVEVWAHEQRTV